MPKRLILQCLIIGLMLAGCITSVGPPPTTPITGQFTGPRPPLPQVGDIAVYRVRNAYNGETRGEVQYRVDKVEGERVTVAVTPTSAEAGLPRTEIYTADGNWLRHPVTNHQQSIEYEFLQPYPAYVFPMQLNRAWSTRVDARNVVTGRTTSVRIDAEVIGSERMTTAAGTFDVLKIRRRVYAGDWDGFQRETNIIETEWYAPGPGRTVRLETNSSWVDTSRSAGGGMFGGGVFGNYLTMRGDWNVIELVSAPATDKAAAR